MGFHKKNHAGFGKPKNPPKETPEEKRIREEDERFIRNGSKNKKRRN